MGINTAGTPSTTNYVLGRGPIFFASVDANGFPVAYRHLGNATAFSANLSSDTIEHETSRSGLKTVDLEIITKQKLGLSLTLDELDFGNLALFLSGEAANQASTVATVNAAKTTVTDRQIALTGAGKKGRWYDLTNSSGGRLYDIAQANLTVKTGTGTTPGATLSPGSDYTVDLVLGRIFMLSTGSGHTDGNPIFFTHSARAGASDLEQVRAMTQSTITGALKFILVNANGGHVTEFQFHAVTLKPEGDLSLIGDEYAELTLTGTAGKNETVSPNSPVCTITTHAAA